MKSTIKNYLSGKSSGKEQKELLNWIREDNHLAEFQNSKKEWKDEIINEAIPSDYQGNWNSIQNNLYGQMQSDLQRTRRMLSFLKYAAILVALISIPTLAFFFSQTNSSSPLTYTTVATELGQISKVVLPDSSVIWINSGSSISYNNQFSQKNRDIQLTGEAFFKIQKNKELPLIVTSSDIRVKVLGTEFCVSAYPEEDLIQVILEKGKVELTSATNSNFKQEIRPGEMASFDKRKKELSVSTVNTGLFTSWKDGIINIYNLPLSELIIKLERRYNQKFVIDNEIKHLPYTFTIKNENLNSILSLIEKITPVDAVQHGNIIELKYNKKKSMY